MAGFVAYLGERRLDGVLELLDVVVEAAHQLADLVLVKKEHVLEHVRLEQHVPVRRGRAFTAAPRALTH